MYCARSPHPLCPLPTLPPANNQHAQLSSVLARNTYSSQQPGGGGLQPHFTDEDTKAREQK